MGTRINGAQLTQITGSTLEEQLTEGDAVGGVLTFSANVEYVEIVNLDTSNSGTFTVNGVDIEVPTEVAFGPVRIVGTPSDEVTVAGSTDYIVSRYS